MKKLNEEYNDIQKTLSLLNEFNENSIFKIVYTILKYLKFNIVYFSNFLSYSNLDIFKKLDSKSNIIKNYIEFLQEIPDLDILEYVIKNNKISYDDCYQLYQYYIKKGKITFSYYLFVKELYKYSSDRLWEDEKVLFDKYETYATSTDPLFFMFKYESLENFIKISEYYNINLSENDFLFILQDLTKTNNFLEHKEKIEFFFDILKNKIKESELYKPTLHKLEIEKVRIAYELEANLSNKQSEENNLIYIINLIK